MTIDFSSEYQEMAIFRIRSKYFCWNLEESSFLEIGLQQVLWIEDGRLVKARLSEGYQEN